MPRYLKIEAVGDIRTAGDVRFELAIEAGSQVRLGDLTCRRSPASGEGIDVKSIDSVGCVYRNSLRATDSLGSATVSPIPFGDPR